jgi:uncharacterized protein YqeY
MGLENLINDDMKKAMLSKDSEKLEALRAIKAALLLEKTKEGSTGEIPESVELSLLQKLVKQRKESASIYTSGNREDLAQKELFEAAIIEKYLPQQLSDDELEQLIKDIISQTGASSVKDMGKVMGIASKELAGKADGKRVSEIVKKLLVT